MKNLISRSMKAFTLIELLVVVAIIAPPRGYSIPGFSRVRENARRSSCQSNLKQMGLAMVQYTQDYDERFIPHNGGSGEIYTTPRFDWDDILDPYLKNTQIYACPSTNRFSRGYSYNAHVGGSRAFNPTGSNLAGQAGRHETTFSAPVAVPMFVDSAPNTASGNLVRTFCIPNRSFRARFDGCVPDSGNTWSCDQDAAKADTDTHFDGINIVFIDGHVKWRKAQFRTAGTPAGQIAPPRDGIDYDGDGTAGGEGVTTSNSGTHPNNDEGKITGDGWD